MTGEKPVFVGALNGSFSSVIPFELFGFGRILTDCCFPKAFLIKIN